MRKKPSLDLNFKTLESLLNSSSSFSSSKKTTYESYIFKDPQPQIRDFSHITQETHAFIDNSMNSIRNMRFLWKVPLKTRFLKEKPTFLIRKNRNSPSRIDLIEKNLAFSLMSSKITGNSLREEIKYWEIIGFLSFLWVSNFYINVFD